MPVPIRSTEILLGVAVLALAAYAYFEHEALVGARNDADALRTDRNALQARIADLEKAAKARAAVAAAPLPGDPAAGPRAQRFFGEGPVPQPFRDGPGGFPGRFSAMFDNPAMQKLLSIQQKAALDSRYAALFRELNLSPADLDKFKNLLVERQTAVMDAVSAARAQGLSGPENRSALQQVIASANSEVEDNIKTALGDAAYAQYQTYEQTAPERNTVTQLQQRLSYSQTPLTDDQATQIIAIMAANAPERVAGTGSSGSSPASSTSSASSTTAATNGAAPSGAGNAGPGGFGGFRNGGGQAPITDTVIAATQGILNDTQIAALTQLQQEQQAQAQLAAQMRAARQAGPSPGAAAPVASRP